MRTRRGLRFRAPAVAAYAGNQRQLIARLERRADESGAEALVASRLGRSDQSTVVEPNLVRAAVDEPALAPDEQRPARPRLGPLGRDADDVGWHSIDSIEFLAGAWRLCGDDRKRLIVRLTDPEDAGRQKTAGDLASDFARYLTGVRVVHLQWRAVLAVLRENRRATVETPAARSVIAEHAEGRAVSRTSRGIDRTPFVFCDHDVAIGRKPLTRAAERPATALRSYKGRSPPRSHISAFEEHPPRSSARSDREDLDDAANGIGPIQITPTAAENLDTIDRRLWYLVPVHPSGERIVERHAIGEHDRPARARSTESAQRQALCTGIRNTRRAAAIQRKSRHHFQHVVDCRRGPRLQRRRPEHCHRHVRVCLRHLCTRGSDLDLFEERSRFQRDFEPAVFVGFQSHRGRCESRCGDGQNDVGNVGVQLEGPVQAGTSLPHRTAPEFQAYGGVRDGLSLRIHDDQRNRSWRLAKGRDIKEIQRKDDK